MIRSPGPDDDGIKPFLEAARRTQTRLEEQVRLAAELPGSPSRTERVVRLNRIRRETDQILDDHSKFYQQFTTREVSRHYTRGHLTASFQLDTSIDLSLPHREAIQYLQTATHDEVARNINQVKRQFRDATDAAKPELTRQRIRTLSRSATAEQLISGLDDTTATARRLRNNLFAEAITVTDAGGRTWSLESYTRMLTRTQSAIAYNTGSLAKAAEEGVQRLQVFDGTTHDAECAQANGNVWSFKYATQHLLAHPNCRRAFGPIPHQGQVNQFDVTEATEPGGRRLLAALKVFNEFHLPEEVLTIFEQLRSPVTSLDLSTIFPSLARAEALELRLTETNYIGAATARLSANTEAFIVPVLRRLATEVLRDVPQTLRDDFRVAAQRMRRTADEFTELSDAVLQLTGRPAQLRGEAGRLIQGATSLTNQGQDLTFRAERLLSDLRQTADVLHDPARFRDVKSLTNKIFQILNDTQVLYQRTQRLPAQVTQHTTVLLDDAANLSRFAGRLPRLLVEDVTNIIDAATEFTANARLTAEALFRIKDDIKALPDPLAILPRQLPQTMREQFRTFKNLTADVHWFERDLLQLATRTEDFFLEFTAEALSNVINRVLREVEGKLNRLEQLLRPVTELTEAQRAQRQAAKLYAQGISQRAAAIAGAPVTAVTVAEFQRLLTELSEQIDNPTLRNQTATHAVNLPADVRRYQWDTLADQISQLRDELGQITDQLLAHTRATSKVRQTDQLIRRNLTEAIEQLTTHDPGSIVAASERQRIQRRVRALIDESLLEARVLSEEADVVVEGARRRLLLDLEEYFAPEIAEGRLPIGYYQYWDDEQFEAAARLIRNHIEHPPSAAGFDANLLDSLIAYLERVLDPSLASNEELVFVAKALKHPTKATSNLHLYSIDQGVTTRAVMQDLLAGLLSIRNGTLRLASEADAQARQFFGIRSDLLTEDDWIRVFDLGPNRLNRVRDGAYFGLWDEAGLPEVSKRLSTAIKERFIKPLREGVNWADTSGGPIHKGNAEEVLKRLFGDANVEPGPAGSNGMTFFISDSEGRRWFLKWVDGNVNGQQNAVLGEVWGDLILDGLRGSPTPQKFLPGDSRGFWTMSPYLGSMPGADMGAAGFSQIRKLALYEWLMTYTDSHPGQYIMRRTGQLVDGLVPHVIDRELTFESFLFGRHSYIYRALPNATLENGSDGIPAQHFIKMLDDWIENAPHQSDLGFPRRWVEPIPASVLPEHQPNLNGWQLTERGDRGAFPSVFRDWVTGDEFLAPGQILHNDAHPTGRFVQYLTDGETRFLNDVVDGVLDDKFKSQFLDAMEASKASQFIGSNNTLEEWTEVLLETFKQRVRKMFDEGFLVRSHDTTIKWADYAGDNTIRLGKRVEFTDIGGDVHSGWVYHMWTDSGRNRLFYLLEDPATAPAGTQRAQMTLWSEGALSRVRSRLDDVADASEYAQMEIPVKHAAYSTNRNLRYSEPLRAVDDLYDEFGVFEAYEPRLVQIDVTGAEALADVVPFDATEIATNVRRVLEEELALLAPEQRPLRIVLTEGMVDGAHWGRYAFEDRTMELSNLLLTQKVPVGEPLNYEGFAAIVRHELQHAASHHANRAVRQQLGRKIIADVVEEIGQPDATWREINETVREFMLKTLGEDFGDNALREYIERRTADIDVAGRRRQGREIVEFLKEQIDDDLGLTLKEIVEFGGEELEEWMQHSWMYARAILDDSVELTPADIDQLYLRVYEEFRAEGIRQLITDGDVVPAGIEAAQDAFWYDVIGDPGAVRFLRDAIPINPFDPEIFQAGYLARQEPRYFNELITRSQIGFNPEELLETVVKQGGASIRVLSGEVPTEGFAVAIKYVDPGSDGVIAARRVRTTTPPEDLANLRITEYRVEAPAELTPENKERLVGQVMEFINRNKDFLVRDDDAGWTLGVYVDELTGEWVFDVSRVEALEIDAVRFAMYHSQDSVYDLTHGQLIWTKSPETREPLYRNLHDYLLKEKVNHRHLVPEEDLPFPLRGVANTKTSAIPFDTDAGPSSVLQAGDQYVITRPDGKPAPVIMEFLPDEWQRRLIKSAAEDYVYEDGTPFVITVEAAKENYRNILRRAIEVYKENPELRTEHRFYQGRNIIWGSLQDTVAPNMPLVVMGAMDSAMSPGLDAAINLEYTTRLITYIGQDRQVRPEDLRRVRRFIQERLDGLKAAGKNESKEAQELRGALRGTRASPKLEAGTSVGMYPTNVAYQIYKLWIYQETGLQLSSQYGTKNIKKAISVGWGRITTIEAVAGVKTRSFTGNQMDPLDELKLLLLTIDFQMLNAGTWSVGLNADGHGGWVSPAFDGMEWGLRGVLSQAVYELWQEGWAEQVGSASLAELQEVIWAIWKLGLEKENAWWGDLPVGWRRVTWERAHKNRLV